MIGHICCELFRVGETHGSKVGKKLGNNSFTQGGKKERKKEEEKGGKGDNFFF